MGEQFVSHPPSLAHEPIASGFREHVAQIQAYPEHLVFESPFSLNRDGIRDETARFYQSGVRRYLHSQVLDVPLPDERLWPDVLHEAYGWMRDTRWEIAGTPELILDELIRNADIHGKGLAAVAAGWDQTIFHLMIVDNGRGLGSSSVTIENRGHMFIGFFATEKIEFILTPKNHIIHITRDLANVEQTKPDMFTARRVKEVQALHTKGISPPANNPLDNTYMRFNPSIGPLGGMEEFDALGQPTGVVSLYTESDVWDN
jgi:hypothetical protein